MATVHDVLDSKLSSRVLTILPAASVLDAVEKMNELKVGGLIVMEDGQVLGIFTERDVLRRVVGELRKPSTTTVNEVMTRDVYQWLYPIERTLGFMVIAYQLGRRPRIA